MSEYLLSDRVRSGTDIMQRIAGGQRSALIELSDEIAALEQANANLEERLLSVLEVAVARGERLGYADEDYRETLAQGDE